MNNSKIDFSQFGQDSTVKLKELQGSFKSLGSSIDQLAESMTSASTSMTDSISALNENMTQLGISATIVVNSITSMATAIMANAEIQIQAQEMLNGTTSAFDQLQAKADQVKANFLGLMGNSSALFMTFLDGVSSTNELISLYRTIKSSLAGVSLELIKSTVKVGLLNAATSVCTGVTKGLAAIQKVWNLAMTSNPLGLLVKGISMLVISLGMAYNTFDGFREIVDSAWEGVKKLGSVIWDGLVKAFEKLSSVFEPIWSKLKTFLGIQEEVTATTQTTTEAVSKYADATDKATGSTGNFAGALDGQNKTLKLNLNTLGGIEQKISQLRAKQKTVSVEQAADIEKEIGLLEDKKNLMERTIIQKANGDFGKAPTPLLEVPPIEGLNVKGSRLNASEKIEVPDVKPVQEISEETDELQEKIVSFNESIFGSGSIISQWADNATAGIRRMTDICKEFGEMMKNDTLNSVQKVSGGLMGIGAMAGAMGSMVEGSAGAWLDWGGNILAMVATALPQLLALFGVESALAVAEQAKLPFPLNLVAIGATIAGITAAIMSVPKPKKMATGGLAYGSVFAQVGEYPGAANNPEVIAPLSKLKNMLAPQGFEGGTVEFRIKGNRLVGILDKEQNKGRFF